MSPIPADIPRYLLRRDSNGDDEECVGLCDNAYIRWVIAIIIVIFLIFLFVLYWGIAVKRATGQWGWARTAAPTEPSAVEADTSVGILRNNRRRRNRRRHHQQDATDESADPVPVYHASPGQDDAGYYDPQGNYIAHEPPPYEPPKAILRTHEEEVELDSIAAENQHSPRNQLREDHIYEPATQPPSPYGPPDRDQAHNSWFSRRSNNTH